MSDDLVTGFLPGLATSSKAGFNVFDDMVTHSYALDAVTTSRTPLDDRA